MHTKCSCKQLKPCVRRGREGACVRTHLVKLRGRGREEAMNPYPARSFTLAPFLIQAGMDWSVRGTGRNSRGPTVGVADCALATGRFDSLKYVYLNPPQIFRSARFGRQNLNFIVRQTINPRLSDKRGGLVGKHPRQTIPHGLIRTTY